MGQFDFSVVYPWVIFILAIFALSKLSKWMLGSKTGGGVVQSKVILVNSSVSEVIEKYISLVRQDPKLKQYLLDEENAVLVVDKRIEFSRAPARITIKIKEVSSVKSEVTIESRPKYYLKGVTKIDFGQNSENVEYFSAILTRYN